MRKALLVIEDYRESTFLQGLLMKFGWDIKIVRKDLLVKDELLSFNPEVILAVAKGHNINGIALSQKAPRWKKTIKTVLIASPEISESPELLKANADEILLRPIDPVKILQTMARVSGQDEWAIVAKYHKLFSRKDPMVGMPEVPEELLAEEHDFAPTAFSHQETEDLAEKLNRPVEPLISRVEIYQKTVNSIKPEELQQWDKKRIEAECKKTPRPYDQVADDLRRQKEYFVRALFRKS